MKKIEDIIRSFRLDHVKKGLYEMGVTARTVSEVKGHVGKKATRKYTGGAENVVDFLAKIIKQRSLLTQSG